jgi:hypothetical protein
MEWDDEKSFMFVEAFTTLSKKFRELVDKVSAIVELFSFLTFQKIVEKVKKIVIFLINFLASKLNIDHCDCGGGGRGTWLVGS